ncbi:MAG: aminotransferase class I/II-fold pyridoxal phosphate-dependent enzyme, partial [Bacteroidetes bacterium]
MVNKAMKQILLSPPHLAGNENEYIQQVLDSNWIAPVGKMLDAFEQSVCDYTGAKYALATNSGTAAIHLGLRLLGVGKGDYVICPTLTFIATANPALYLGANLIFVDCDETGNISPAYLEKALAYCAQTGKQVKVVIIVHLYGQNAQISELLAITQKYGVAVLEDAAEALGSTYEGKALGTFGDVGVLSFNGNKIITTSGGGMLLLPTAEMREKALFWATQAKDSAPHYQHSEIGYNYRLSNVLAGIGVAQMQVLPTRLQQKRAIFEKWVEGLKGRGVEGWRGRGVEGLKGKGNISFLNPMMPPLPPFYSSPFPP